MVTSKMCSIEDMDLWDSDDDEEFGDHYVLKERLRKTLHFGKTSKMDRTPLPMTELTVEYFQEAIPRQLGRVDMYWASSFTRKTSVSPCAMMLGMLYIERLRHKNPHYLEKMSSEDLFLISMMVASKYLYDEGVTEEVYNDEWADATNLDVEDLNELEIDFLSAMDWRLFVAEDSFQQLLGNTERCVALKEAGRYGYMTYTDLFVLSQNGQIVTAVLQMLSELCKVVAMFSVVYLAGVYSLSTSPAALTTIQRRLEACPVSPADFLHLDALSDLIRLHTGLSALCQSPHCTDLPTTQNNQNTVIYDYPAADLDLDLGSADLGSTDLGSIDPGSDLGSTESAGNKKHGRDFTRQTKPIHRKTTRKPASSSSFITLELLKETLMMFVVGMKGGSTNEAVMEDESEHGTKSTCNCPHCPRKTQQSCTKKNATYLSNKNNNLAKDDESNTAVTGTEHPGSWVRAYGALSAGYNPSDDPEAAGGRSDNSRLHGNTAGLDTYNRPSETFNQPCSQVFRKSSGALKHHGISQSLMRPIVV